MSAGPAARLQTRALIEAAARTAGVDPEQIAEMVAVDVGQTDSELVYDENKLSLQRYEPDERRHETPVLVVYALVNKPYILDLQPDRSVVRRLLEAGFEVYLIDWGEPSRLDCSLTMTDYVDRYLDNCVDAVRDRAGVDDVHLLGYCMGGTMSLMYAARRSEKVRTLSLMATPVALDGTGGVLERWAAHFDPGTAVETFRNLPSELLTATFSLLNPVEQHVTKYVRLFENVEDADFVRNFARMEQWIRDGVDVAGAAYREFVDEIYRDNALAAGEYRLAGERVDLSGIELPVQQIVGEYDHIVPPDSSRPLNDIIASEDERVLEFPAGHVGISVSSSAHEELWPDVCEWLTERSSGDAATADYEATRVDSLATPDATNGHDPTVDTVRGIGQTYAERLGEAGVETVADLRERDLDELADAADASLGRVENWLDQVA